MQVEILSEALETFAPRKISTCALARGLDEMLEEFERGVTGSELWKGVGYGVIFGSKKISVFESDCDESSVVITSILTRGFDEPTLKSLAREVGLSCALTREF